MEHIGRGVMQFISIVSIFAAFAVMPLADAVAITFSAPLFLTLLSIPMLGERVGRHRWAAVLVGFLGVLLMVATRDGFGSGIVSTGALLALLSAALSASVTIAVRRMTLTEATPTLVTYQALITLLLSSALLPLGWITPRWDDLMLLAAIGVCSGIGQYWWTQAFRFAPAAVAAPFSYLAIVWALVLGYAVWADVPTPSLIAGALVVAASGLYILYRETVSRAATACISSMAARSTARTPGSLTIRPCVAPVSTLTGLKPILPQSFIHTASRMRGVVSILMPAAPKRSAKRARRGEALPSGSPSTSMLPPKRRTNPGSGTAAAI